MIKELKAKRTKKQYNDKRTEKESEKNWERKKIMIKELKAKRTKKERKQS